MKKCISLILCLALCLTALPVGAGAAFTDISDEDTAVAAAALQGMGVVSGTSSTAFSPDETLTRAQACTMAVNAAGLGSQVSTYARRTLFTDVPASAWYNGYVNLAYSQGFVNGNGDGTFRPDDPVTYGEMATILLRMLGYTSAEIGSVWPLDYTGFCDDLGLSDGLGLGAYDQLTRGEAAVLLYRAMKAEVNGSDQPYYETISGISSTGEVILLDTDASYGGSDGLLMVYDTAAGETAYYTQKLSQSETLEGYLGTLLFDSSGRAAGFLPEDGGTLELTVDSATASTLTDRSGTSYRISSGAVVISGGETYPYSTSGYLQVNAKAGSTVRLYYNDAGSIAYLWLSGGTGSSSETAVATAASAGSLARALGVSGSYSITKNGAAADSGDIAAYDVGYYDAASGTLRVSDYRVSGYLTAASPSVTAAETVTVAGCSLEVLESAWDTLGELSLGQRVTLLLTDDCKVAAAYPAAELSAEMVGVLAEDGRSVTLAGSGVALSAEDMDYDEEDRGGLVTVTASSATRLRCSAVSSDAAGTLDLDAGTLGELELASALAVYEWAGGGYVCDLEGEQGAFSTGLEDITWTDSLSASAVSYYHVNSAGQVDVLLLEDVTGNCYEYGRVSVYSGSEGINLGSGTMEAYNQAAALTNSEGSTGKMLCTQSVTGGRYVGLALGRYSDSYERVMAVRTLTTLTGSGADDFFQQDGSWYAEADGEEYPVSDQVQVYFEDSETWLSGEEGLAAALADNYDLTLYCDAAPSAGGQIRIVTAG